MNALAGYMYWLWPRAHGPETASRAALSAAKALEAERAKEKVE